MAHKLLDSPPHGQEPEDEHGLVQGDGVHYRRTSGNDSELAWQ